LKILQTKFEKLHSEFEFLKEFGYIPHSGDLTMERHKIQMKIEEAKAVEEMKK